MVKLSKSFRKQAEQAERAAQSARDPELASEYQTLAKAYRSQAEVLKKRVKKKKQTDPKYLTDSK